METTSFDKILPILLDPVKRNMVFRRKDWSGLYIYTEWKPIYGDVKIPVIYLRSDNQAGFKNKWAPQQEDILFMDWYSEDADKPETPEEVKTLIQDIKNG